MARKLTVSFDELMRRRYGDAGGEERGVSVQIEELFRNYYGREPAKPNGHAGRAPTVARRSDNGETLRQAGGTGPSFAQEYIVGEVRPAGPPPATTAPAAEPTPEERAPASERTAPPSGDPARRARDSAASPPAPPPYHPAAVLPRAEPDEASARQECRVDLVEPAKAGPLPSGGGTQTKDDEFVEDMKSILSGQMVFDPATKKTVAKAVIDKTSHHGVSDPRAASVLNNPPALPVPEGTGQAIFDRIAQSMHYANAYNVGTIALDNRFAEFDALEELEQSARKKKALSPVARTPVTTPAVVPPVASEEFVRDLDAIRRDQAAAFVPAASAAPVLAQSLRPYSQPLFDTGEHVQAGGDLFAAKLMVGGVPFSYGQIISMADLFDSAKQMMAADPAELRRLKDLIDKSTAHYTRRGADVEHEDWDDATGGRYLKLAEDNYEHFSPPLLIGGNRARTHKGDNKAAWERHHREAIAAVQEQFLSQPGSTFYERALIINAFGDHFLTDAFASGHIINKEVMVDAFKRNFLRGGSLTSDADTFFLKVALKAFRGDVARKFSQLETVDYPVCALGWCFKWRPNIDSPSMFAKLLTAAAEQQPERVANLAVKALHDRLNQDGVYVDNDLSDVPWLIKGDGSLDAANLKRMRKAVQQSVDNLTDPTVFSSAPNFSALFHRVWRHVPRLAGQSLVMVPTLIDAFTTPTDTLADAAADVIYKQVNSMVKALLKEGKLKAA